MNDSAEPHPTRIGEFAEILLNPKTSDDFISSQSLRSFVESRLKQYRLNNTEVEEVLGEAFLRALKKHENEIIRFPKALMRSFCFNVIREMNRGQQRFVALGDEALERIPNPEADLAFLEGVNFQTRKKLENFLKNLSWIERKIIDLWSKSYSTKEIVERLKFQGNLMTVECVKKRRQRLISRLRKELLG